MRLTFPAATLMAALALMTPVFAQDEADVMAQIESLHGKSIEFGEAFALLQDAFLFGEPATLADLGVYPLTINANGETYDLIEAQDLVDNFDYLLTEQTIEALSNQDFADLIVTSDGVGFGEGVLWMALVCADDACSDSHWGIIAINN
jgi:hypothetical protein